MTMNQIRIFKILYTHQKQKKAKTWQDGTLKYNPSNRRGTIISENQATLDHLFVKEDQLFEDAELESEKYLIQVESLEESQQDTKVVNQQAKKISPIQSNQKKTFSNKKFRPPQPMKENLQSYTKSNENSIRNDGKSIHSQNAEQYSGLNTQNPFEDRERNNYLRQSRPNTHSSHTVSSSSTYENDQLSTQKTPNRIRSYDEKSCYLDTASHFQINTRRQNALSNSEREVIQPSNSAYAGGARYRFDRVKQIPDGEKRKASKRSANDVLSLFDTSDDDEIFSQVEIPQVSQTPKETYPPADIEESLTTPLRHIIKEKCSAFSESGTSQVENPKEKPIERERYPYSAIEETPIALHPKESCAPWTEAFEHPSIVSSNTAHCADKRESASTSAGGNRYFFNHQIEEPPFSRDIVDDDEGMAHCTAGMKRSVGCGQFGNNIVNEKRMKRSTSGYFHRSFDENENEEIVDFCTKEDSTINEHDQRVPVLSRVKSNKKFTPPTSKSSFQGRPLSNVGSEYQFPSRDQCHGNTIPNRGFRTPITFNSVSSYKHAFKTALLEHLNIILWETASKYHSALESIDITSLSDSVSGSESGNNEKSETRPSCKHGAATLKTVRKEGKNKGRMFYSCSVQGDKRCNLFVWLDEAQKQSSNGGDQKSQGKRKPIINDYQSLMTVFQSRAIELYCGVKITRKSFNFFKRAKQNALDLRPSKKALYIVLPKKKASSCYNKEDLWVISKTLEFQPESLFIARSVFYGPNSSCELEILPLASYSISSWDSGAMCHAIQVCNASTEFSCLDNLEKHVQSMDVPVLSRILSPVSPNKNSARSIYASTDLAVLIPSELTELLQNTVEAFSLNEDQASAIKEIAWMFAETSNSSGESNNITLIHGVFGAGKSFLLSVTVLFLLQLFERVEETLGLETNTLKLMISSTTNVAVDRVLCCLLNHGYEDFIRVGSLRKIAKVILPNSLHVDESNDQELKELNAILKSELTEKEKGYVKQAIEMHKMGANRKRLKEVRVVGVTCAASSFPLLKDSVFQVHLLDECSQMIEPLSLLPIARFKCERLVLVGDPNQLSPTIQGSESEHSDGLELTLFERLQKAGVDPVVLRCQYRCHPLISTVCSKMFYKGSLLDGVSESDRLPTVDWLPSISVVDIHNGSEMTSSDGSIYNMKEVGYCVKLVSAILSEGVEPSKIGIITQYKAQVNKLQSQLQDTGVLSSTELKGVQISTVDAFQGAEKDIIILSCVRTNFIGFINCPRRTNVALSRARHHLVVVGNLRLLRIDQLWNEVLETINDAGGTFGRGENALIPDAPKKVNTEITRPN